MKNILNNTIKSRQDCNKVEFYILKIILLSIFILFSQIIFSQNSWNPKSLSLPDKGQITVRNLDVYYLNDDPVNKGHQYIRLGDDEQKKFIGQVKFSNTYFEMSLFDINSNHLTTFYFTQNILFKLKSKDNISAEYLYIDNSRDGTKTEFVIRIQLDLFNNPFFSFSFTESKNNKVISGCIMRG